MLRKPFFLLLSISLISIAVNAQSKYKILIKGGHVIDAKNNINETMDVAIQDGKIVRVAKNIDTALALQECM